MKPLLIVALSWIYIVAAVYVGGIIFNTLGLAFGMLYLIIGAFVARYMHSVLIDTYDLVLFAVYAVGWPLVVIFLIYKSRGVNIKFRVR